MSRLDFTLDVREPERRLARLTLELDRNAWSRADGSGGALELFLPAWTPGSYLIREYVRHVEGVAAEAAEDGRPLPVAKTAKNRFRVEVPDGCDRVRVRYAVYAHELTVRTADLDDSHAFWDGACFFLWPVDRPELPARITVRAPLGWRIHSPLPRPEDTPAPRLEAEEVVLLAEGLADVVDAPGLAGRPKVLTFEVLGKPHRFLLDGLGSVTPPTTLVDDTRRICEEAAALFDHELPYESYDFYALFDHESRGGLEHRTCSVLLAPRTTFQPRRDHEDFLGLVAHEFFHVWNVKRMRPAEFVPYDLEVETYTELLWVAEGFTAYYDDLLCLRAGVLDTKRYLEIVAGVVANLLDTPGRAKQSLAQASFDAWIKLYRPDENTRNSTLSYYGNGGLVALGLDLALRAANPDGRGLDDVVAALYRRWETSGEGYTHDDVRALVVEHGDASCGERLDRWTRAPMPEDLTEFFAPAGLRLEVKPGKAPVLGVRMQAAAPILVSVVEGSPAHEGGLCPGDELLAIEGLRTSTTALEGILSQVTGPGDTLRVLVARRGRILEREVPRRVSPHAEVTLVPDPDASEAAVALRDAWLAPRRRT